MIPRRWWAAVASLLAALALASCTPYALAQPPRDPLIRTTQVAGATLAYCASTPIEEWGAGVRRVIVGVHGLDRNACGMRRAIVDALGGEPADTVVVAPHFATAVDAFAGGHAWAAMTWPEGAEATTGASSYAVLDALVAQFGGRSVTLVGFSGGGQFTNRYAAVSPVDLDSYVVINPSSYVWFTAERPGPTRDCPAWDAWRYGLDDRSGYASRLDEAAITAQYGRRSVRYLIGTADDDPHSPSLDRSCGAMAQGTHRLDRAFAYQRHLHAVFGPGIVARQPVIVVPGVGHDGGAMLASTAGRRALGG
ncbi:MAG: alpha/beta hydrolase [Propionibacteriaceae bacterium]|nr:alpha/beta hydrolase [Propionibacteriaceae bacterium]